MGTYLEIGVGKATQGKPVDMGRTAAKEALAQLHRFQPSLALVFISSELDLEEVHQGVYHVLPECPLIGTSTAGEIAGELIEFGVVVTLLASPHLKVRTGLGTNVSQDYQAAACQALTEADALGYFDPKDFSHQMLNISTCGAQGPSPVLVIMFSPGGTQDQFSLSHELHSFLVKASSNRIPIFGGSSADYFHFTRNYQIAGRRVVSNAVALAVIETDLLFGLGLAHGFKPTHKSALITKAHDHIVQELDNRPAAEVCAELLGISLKRLYKESLWFSRFPFGVGDLFGNYLLQVPERVLEDRSIQFGPLMRKNQVITLMSTNSEDILRASWEAYELAIRKGGIKKPLLSLMFSCALRRRLLEKEEAREVHLVAAKSSVPVAGFYTFGEKGLSDNGLPVYTNQSVSMLVFADQLNPVSALLHKNRKVYLELDRALKRKETQMQGIVRISHLAQNEMDWERLTSGMIQEIGTVFPWTECAFYVRDRENDRYYLNQTSRFSGFPDNLALEEAGNRYHLVPLSGREQCLGLLALMEKEGGRPLDEEDLAAARIIGELAASGMQRIDLDRRVEKRLQQVVLLNKIADEVAHSSGVRSLLRHCVAHVREIMSFSVVNLWVFFPSRQLLVHRVTDVAPGIEFGPAEQENDERLARWQIKHLKPFFLNEIPSKGAPVRFTFTRPCALASIPIVYQGEPRGVLNVYQEANMGRRPLPLIKPEEVDFLHTLSRQLAITMENIVLQRHSILYKEIHHRVKNNLQNIASILRLQIRRLDRKGAEQALEDCISRIMSIAQVHETLSKDEIGMVDIRALISRIARLAVAGQTENSRIKLTIVGKSIMVPSREATALALVANELVQNAVEHGLSRQTQGKIQVRIKQTNGLVSLVVKNDGSGLPEEFNPQADGHLGLTIVRMLVKDELKGNFNLLARQGTQAEVIFPLPQIYQLIK